MIFLLLLLLSTVCFAQSEPLVEHPDYNAHTEARSAIVHYTLKSQDKAKEEQF